MIDKFFSQCLFCESRKTSPKILECDSIIPFETNLAYAVHFKLTKNKRKNFKKGKLSTKSNTTISKIESEIKWFLYFRNNFKPIFKAILTITS